jgi:hypothetical protein
MVPTMANANTSRRKPPGQSLYACIFECCDPADPKLLIARRLVVADEKGLKVYPNPLLYEAEEQAQAEAAATRINPAYQNFRERWARNDFAIEWRLGSEVGPWGRAEVEPDYRLKIGIFPFEQKLMLPSGVCGYNVTIVPVQRRKGKGAGRPSRRDEIQAAYLEKLSEEQRELRGDALKWAIRWALHPELAGKRTVPALLGVTAIENALEDLLPTNP